MAEKVQEQNPQFKRIPLNSKGELIKNSFGLKSPRRLVVVKYPKSGSTLSICDVPKILIADSEAGTDYFTPNNVASLIDDTVKDKFVSTKKYGYVPQTIFDLVDELSTANNMDVYWNMYTSMKNERDLVEKEKKYNDLVAFINTMPFPILAIDTITSIVGLSNQAALWEYNLGVKESSQKEDIKRADEYGGVQYIRRKFDEIKAFIEQNAAPFIQYHGHVATRKKVLKKSEEDVTALDIALDGIMSTIFTARADAVATFYRDDKGCWLDFSKRDETDLGSRSLHVSNRKLLIAKIMKDEDLANGKRPETFWHDVYPEIQFK
jgi:hypothetical protein